MRSTYDDFAIVADNELAKKYNNNSNNNNNNYYNNNNISSHNYSASGGSNSSNNSTTSVASSAIPYHARENSLPFSYGQIATSTPLRKTPANAADSTERMLDAYLDNLHTNLNTNHNNNNNVNQSLNGNMIKTQPRLTSPLLVRKTLNSRSPTRASNTHTNTNTISNTYHYNTSGGGGGGIGGTTPRDDLEELLRERREKVLNEYRHNGVSSLGGVPGTERRTPPAPPQRQHYGTTTRGATNSNGQTNGKYNYDFEFNLNLHDFDLDTRPTSLSPHARTLERTPARPPLPHQQPYYTQDIPDAAAAAPNLSSSSSRNYHTISSSIAKTANRGETLSAFERPPLEVTTYSSKQQTTYGGGGQHHNGNPATTAVYGNANNNLSSTTTNNLYRSNNNKNVDLAATSPIYATTTKQQLRSIQQQSSSNLVNYGGGSGGNIVGTNTNNIYNRSSSSTNNNQFEPDYPISSAMTPSPTARPETPAFPVTPRTPYGGSAGSVSVALTHANSPTPPRFDSAVAPNIGNSESIYQSTTLSAAAGHRPRLNSSLSLASNTEPQEVAPHLVKFARNSAKFWYKPNLSREDAIALLLNAPPGTFVVRDSTTFKNAYGLVLRVAQPPPGSNSNEPQELVRHFLIEPTQRGVRLKGCANEPVFTSLSALIYEHSINQLALPCLLRIPEDDVVPSPLAQTPAQKQLLAHGAATNVLWLYSCETESLTGVEAIRKAIRQLYALQPPPTPTEVHFKVTQQGITLTDNTRKKFFRKHYSADIISFCAIDPDNRLWTLQPTENGESKTANTSLKKTIFAFVARRSLSSKDNQCHIFCDLSISQPASAIVSFANRTLPTEKQRNYML